MLEAYHEIIDLQVEAKVWKLFHMVEENYDATDISSRFAASGAIQLLLSMLLKNQANNNLAQNKFLPVVDYVNVGTMEEADAKISIVSQTGKKIYDETVKASAFAPARIDMSTCAPGVYSVIVTLDGNEYKKTITKI